jgi:amino acid transporter
MAMAGGETHEASLDDFDASGDDIVLVNEKALNWFDVSAIGTGEMLFTAAWSWIMYIGSLYGIKWTLIGFAEGALIINMAWWLYREMITAVPEPGSIQSYGREAGLFSIGTTYFVGYVPIYGAFMWLELTVAKGLLHGLFPSVPTGIWPYAVLLPVMALNLFGHQITGKVQAILVIFTLVGDVLLGLAIWWLMADHATWAANWQSPTPIDWLTPFTVGALWIAIMAGILEVQQVLVDEWSDFERSRDIGLLSAAWQLWARQIPVALGLMATLPLGVLAAMNVPTVEAVAAKLGHGPVFYLGMISMLVATYTTLSVFFMAEGKVLALYAQQGALPRFVGQYSSRSVPWVAIVFMAVFALAGVYITHIDFIIAALTEWSATLYFVIAVFYLRMKQRTDLERPVVVKYGVPIAIFVALFSVMGSVAAIKLNWQASLTWFAIVAVFVFYDAVIVPRTKRGGFYRAQVLRKRSSALRL